MTDPTATSWGAGSPSTKQGQLGNRTHFTGFRYLRSVASVVSATSMFLLVLALCCRSTCQFRGNSEKRNHMLSATSKVELEVLTKFRNMSKLRIRLISLYQRVLLQNIIHILKNSIGAITKIFFSLPLVPQIHSSCTSFLNYGTQFLLLFSSSTILNFTFQPIFFKIDSCCYGSDYVNLLLLG